MMNNNNRLNEQKEPEMAPITHDVGGAIDFNKLQSDKNLGIRQQPLMMQQQPIMQQQQQTVVLDKNKPSTLMAQTLVSQVLLEKNNLAQLEPELKQEIVHHAPLHHTAIVSDHSAPVLVAPTDASSSSAMPTSTTANIAATIAGMRDQVTARANQMAANVSQAASNLTAVTAEKIQEMKQDVAPTATPHYIQPQLKQELVQHAPLHHTAIVEDHSAPVLSVPSDRNIAPTPTVAASIGDLKDIAVAKAAPIAASLSATASSVAASAAHSIAEKAAQLKLATAQKIAAMKKEQELANAPHYIQPQLKQELIQHAPLHHTTIVEDHSAPVLSVPSDRNIAPPPSTMSQLGDLKDILVAKAAPHVASLSAATSAAASSAAAATSAAASSAVSATSAAASSAAAATSAAASSAAASASAAASSAVASISGTASQLKQAATNKITQLKQDKEQANAPHYIQPELKEELVHHAPLNHVTDVSKDHSAPVLSAPTDAISSGPISTPPTTSCLSSFVASLKHAGEVLVEKSVDAGHIVQAKAAEAAVALHLSSAPAQQQPASAVLVEETKAVPVHRETVRHAVPQHPDIMLHPGPIDLSNVHSTLPANLKTTNQLASQSFDAKNVEVHNGGIAWAVPLEGAALASSSAAQPTVAQPQLLVQPVLVQPVAVQPQTLTSISTGPNSVTYSTLSTTPSTITYTTTTKTVETIPASDLNRRI